MADFMIEKECRITTPISYDESLKIIDTGQEWKRGYCLLFSFGKNNYKLSDYTNRAGQLKPTDTFTFYTKEYTTTAFNTNIICIERKRTSSDYKTGKILVEPAKPNETTVIYAQYIYYRAVNKFWRQTIMYSVRHYTSEFIDKSPAEQREFMEKIIETFDNNTVIRPRPGLTIELIYTALNDYSKYTQEDFDSFKEFSSKHMNETELKIYNLTKQLSVYVDKANCMIFKQLYQNPVQLSHYELAKSVPTLENAVILAKTDGIHMFLINFNKKASLFSSNLLFEFETNVDELYVLEGEYIEKTNIFWVFDAVYIFGIKVLNDSYLDVITDLRENITDLFKDSKPTIRVKDILIIDSITSNLPEFYKKHEKQIKEMASAGDGLIFYISQSQEQSRLIFKWKPTNKLTIDFYAKRVPDRLLARYGGAKTVANEIKTVANGVKTTYYLFNYCSRQIIEKIGIKDLEEYDIIFPPQSKELKFPNVPVQFSPMIAPNAFIYHSDSNDDLDGKIIELSISDPQKNPTWKFERIREDKQHEALNNGIFGNYIGTAESTYTEIFNPLTLEQIFSANPESSYFAAKSDNFYKKLRYANSLFKGYWFDKYCKKNTWHVDLAAGQGADINRYRANEIENVLLIDRDDQAVSETISRRYQVNERGDKNEFDTKIYYANYDLNESCVPLIQKLMSYSLPPFGYELADKIKYAKSTKVKYEVDSVSCNMAIHYFAATIDNFINLVRILLKSGGIFFYTCFDGKKIFNLLKEGPIEVYQGDRLKYKIVAKYDTTKYKEYSPADGLLFIDVLMPFSDGELYEEALIDSEWLHKKFGSGFELLEEKHNIIEESDTDEDDKFYASLYCGAALKMKL